MGRSADQRVAGSRRERRDAEAELRRSEALHRSLIDNLPDAAVFYLDHELRVVVARGSAPKRLPWFAEGLFVGQRVTDLRGTVPSDVLEPSIAMYREVLDGASRELEFESAGVHFHLKAVPVRDAAGAVEGALVVARDVTAKHRDAQALERHARRQRAAAALGQLALRERDLHALLWVAARTLTTTLGVELAVVLEHRPESGRLVVRAAEGWGLDPGATFNPDGQAGHTFAVGRPVVCHDVATERRFELDPACERHGVASGLSVVIEGREAPFGVLAAHARRPRRFGPEDVDFVTTVASVISAAIERHRDEEASRHAALHDPLTGLPNRTLLLDRLDRALGHARREGAGVAVLVIDLDGFKLINDSLGHAEGDQLLRALAPRLRGAVRDDDTVARLGGDEFAVVCQGAGGLGDVVTIAEKLAAAVAAPFALGGAEHFVTASIGIAIARGGSTRAGELLRDADVAMYRAKAAGRGRFEIFNDEMRARLLSRIRTETELRRALDRDELRVFYQPVVDLETGEVVAVEALARWQHPRLDLVGPDSFIDTAEETGLIVELGERVLHQAASRAAAWQVERPKLELSVNVSARQLGAGSLGAEVARIVGECGLRAGSLALEVTEGALIDESRSPRASLQAVRDHGLKLWLDDFGTGYSSLSYLQRFPLDGIKIDRAFVAGLGTNAGDTAIVQAIVRMAQALDLTVVAEGVETALQLALLRDLGCDRVQGYLLSRPLPERDVEASLGAHPSEVWSELFSRASASPGVAASR